MTDLPEPMPAATLILMRPSANGPPDLLMTERAGTMAFAAGALVFPGGRVDADDHRSSERLGSGLGDAPARIAAIRETIEETGTAAGLVPAPGAATMLSLREGLERQVPFVQLLDRYAIGLELRQLTAFARWCPNFRETRRFDTLFYIAEAPRDVPAPIADKTETVRAFWAPAIQIIEDIVANRAFAIFPTRRNLERLARFASIGEARADAAAYPVEKITPWLEERDGEKWVCIPSDMGYPVTAERLATARRS